MEIATAFTVMPAEGERPGALAAFPYDRGLVDRFREAFPRARWRQAESVWFVPGTTAPERVEAWIARELADLDRHADDRGRDAFAFEPIESRYLIPAEDLLVRTPYSRTVVAALRAIPFARWDPEERVWRVPYRSLEELRRRWPEIEAAAVRNEPEAKRRRREEQGPPDPLEAAVQAERRRHRYPLRADDPPPVDMPVAVHRFGVVVFDAMGEVAENPPVSFPHVAARQGDIVWGWWRMPTFRELAVLKPAPEPVPQDERERRGWWRPNREELRERQRTLRVAQRRRGEDGGGESLP
jgi:hypothetical protein